MESREPAPLEDYKRVNIGDVGYISQGSFHRLFNASLPADHDDNRNGVPEGFVELDIGTIPIKRREPRLPTVLHTNKIITKGIEAGVTSLPLGSTIRFESSASKGAILVTNQKTFRADAIRLRGFARYAVKHVDSWLSFAIQDDRDVKLEDMILVTGYDMTSEYAMAAFHDTESTVALEFQAGLTASSASASVWGLWRSSNSVHHNCGPQARIPPSQMTHAQSLVIGEPLEGPQSRDLFDNFPPNGYNQCVFIRGFRVKKRIGIPRVLKAAAGPHDLGSGDPPDEISPHIENVPEIVSDDSSLEAIATTSPVS
ncbi:hypothetical protein BU17DRAFT_38248 [Hysterangium stoloniferum]|nr:hypothetical protein BU17DRAFT_38248 [Hysterangium stoloniferum]